MLEAYHHADDSEMQTLRDDGRICQFMERTDFHKMRPRERPVSSPPRDGMQEGEPM